MPASDHPIFNSPPDMEIPIWRYMSLARFIWLLQNQALYLARCDRLGDPYEGYFTQPMLTKKDEFIQAFIARQTDLMAHQTDVSPEQIGIDFYNSHVKYSLKMRPLLFVSCWHMNNEESLAMWKLYSTQHESVCIQSTFSTLKRVLPDCCFLGTVNYIDYAKESITSDNLLQYILHKRHSFAHEKEVRAVIWDVQKIPGIRDETPIESDPAKIVPIDLNELIKNVYVSPSSEPLLKDVVEGIVSKYGLKSPVHRSSVLDGPQY